MSLALYYAHQPVEQVSLQGDYVSLTCPCGLQWTTRVETAHLNTRAYLDHWEQLNGLRNGGGLDRAWGLMWAKGLIDNGSH